MVVVAVFAVYGLLLIIEACMAYRGNEGKFMLLAGNLFGSDRDWFGGLATPGHCDWCINRNGADAGDDGRFRVALYEDEGVFPGRSDADHLSCCDGSSRPEL